LKLAVVRFPLYKSKHYYFFGDERKKGEEMFQMFEKHKQFVNLRLYKTNRQTNEKKILQK